MKNEIESTFVNPTLPDQADTAGPAKVFEEDIDASMPSSALPASQFDEVGNIRSDNEIKKEVEAQARLRLSPEQRDILKKHSPRIFSLLEKQEEEERPSTGNAHYVSHPFRPATKMFGKNSIAESYSLFSQQGLRAIADKLLTLDLTDPRNLAWVEEVNNAVSLNPPEDFGLEALNREDSKWVQSIKTESGHSIHGRVFEYPKSSGAKLTGSQAVGYAAAISGAGRPSSFPMMSSGWNAFFRPATNAEWARYYDSVMEARTELGRSTIGVGFATSRSLYVEQALRFALEHLSGVSFKTGSDIEDRTEILRYLSIYDIELFLIGFLVACHPDGYPIRLPCTNISKCNATQELDANLRTMVIFDNKAFTVEQLQHMLRNNTAEMELESVLAYQAGLRTNQPKIVKLKTSHITNEDISIEFQAVSAWDYLESSKRYIDRVKISMKESVSDSMTASKRAQMQNTYYWAEPMREYGHLVKRIYIGDNVIEESPENKANPRVDIEDFLTRASESESMRTAFRESAVAYMQSSVTSLLAAPAYDCPVCGHTTNLSDNPKFLKCVPIDVPMVFFNRALLRLSELVG